MEKVFSVKYLVEAIVKPQDEGKTFEESIVLVRAENKEQAVQKVVAQYEDLTYENAVGGTTTWRFVTALDCFELVDDVEGDVDYKEVYSRYILVEAGTTAEEVIRGYSLDK